MLREKVKETDSGYQATRNKSRSIEASSTSTGSPDVSTMDYLDSAIPRKRAKKRKGLVWSGRLANS